MKLAFLSVILFFGIQSMACDQLIGTWKCKIQDTGAQSTDAYQKNADGALVVTSVTGDGQNDFSLVADGQPHIQKGVIQGAEMKMTYTATLTCNGNSAVFDVNATTTVTQNNVILSQADYASKGTYILNGKQFNLATNIAEKVTQNGQVSNESASKSETCVKQ